MELTKKHYMNIPMEEKLYKRSNCEKIAEEIISDGKIIGMTKSQLACEIFAHAYVYYNFRFVPKFLGKNKVFKSVYRSVSNGVDLEDNGDTFVRRIAYRIIWGMFALPL
ncbi:MAG: hypothetical protein K6F97_03545 [Lachnospiraceae bacterium]|nr:hypothetical protein [Lachnospiraceae bacterium]